VHFDEIAINHATPFQITRVTGMKALSDAAATNARESGREISLAESSA
jgi:hypothetical protein